MARSMVDLFREMVAIPSESGEEHEFIAYLSRILEDEVGASCELDAFGNLVARIPGRDSRRVRPVLLGLHADTVKPGRGIKTIVEDGIIRASGATILGADDKAGIAEAIEAIRSADRHPPLEIVVTREEEPGLVGARNLDYSLLCSDTGFLLDMDDLDMVVVGGPSHMLIDVEVRGRSAHAGLEPEKGISAIRAASAAITLLREGWVDHETTVNVGVMSGGEIRNGVAGLAIVQAECRSLNHQKCLAVSDHVKEVFEKTAELTGATADVRLELAYEAVSIDPTSPVVEAARAAVAGAGLEPRVMTICGGTDASIYNRRGIATIVLGTGVRKPHTVEEHIAIADMEKAVAIVRGVFAHF